MTTLSIPCRNCGHEIPLDIVFSQDEWTCPKCGAEYVNKIYDMGKRIKELEKRVENLEKHYN